MRRALFLSLGLLFAAAPYVLAGGAKCHGDLKAEAADMSSHGWLGLETDKGAGGAYVVKSVVAGSPAEKAGFRKGDVLVAIEGVRLGQQSQEEMKRIKKDFVPGKQVSYTVQRGGAEQKLWATLAAMPREVLAQKVGEHVLDAHLGVEVAKN